MKQGRTEGPGEHWASPTQSLTWAEEAASRLFPRGQCLTLVLDLPNPEKIQAEFSVKDILTLHCQTLITYLFLDSQ